MKVRQISGIQAAEDALCIRVQKVYDWVTRQTDVPIMVITPTISAPFGPFNFNPCVTAAGAGIPTPVVNCYLSDAAGNPINLSNIDCREIPQPGGVRENVTVNVNGVPITLQKVKVAKQGFVSIQVINPQNKQVIASTAGIPWSVSEKFFLCAPSGTTLNCTITKFECDALLICTTPPSGAPTFSELKISISMCQDIQMEAEVKLQLQMIAEVTVEVPVAPTLCTPRAEIPFTCPPGSFPAQCPDVFPVG
jgi:hypothetical protein